MSRTGLDDPAPDCSDGPRLERAVHDVCAKADPPVAVPHRPWWARLLRPVVAVPVTIVALLVSAPLAYRSTRIAGLPLIEHPFDVEASGTIEFAEEENAAPLYAAATAALVELDTLVPGRDPGPELKQALEYGWPGATPPVRAWVAANRRALEAFRTASVRPVFVVHQPKELQFDLATPSLQPMLRLSGLALLEGSRNEAVGSAAEAWACYRAGIRSSRSLGSHGSTIERLVGVAILEEVAPHAARWAGNPQVGASLLRQAFDELEVDLERTVPASQSLRSEYHLFHNTLSRPDFSPELVAAFAFGVGSYGRNGRNERVSYFLEHEPDLSDRVMRHVYSNWLAYIDRPLWERPSVTSGRIRFFEPHPGDLPNVLPPHEIRRYIERSRLASFLIPSMDKIDESIRHDLARAALLRTVFAAQLAFRETGRIPEGVEDLVPKYLAEVPRDPWDAKGAPLKLRPGANGHVRIWSVGFDGIDDGGVAVADVTKGDIVLDTAPFAVPPRSTPSETEGRATDANAARGESKR